VEQMLFLVTTTYPGSSIVDIGKLAIKTLAENPYPEYTKRNYYLTFGGEGIKGYIIYDIEKGNEEEGLKDILNRMTMVSMSIEGAKYAIEPAFTLEEAFAMAGKYTSLEPGSE
jgi:hypothetical protein